MWAAREEDSRRDPNPLSILESAKPVFFSVADARGYPLIGPLAANAAASVFAVLLGGSLRRNKNEESSVG